jgi:hypothetical protein
MGARRYTDPDEIIEDHPDRVTVGYVQSRCRIVEPGVVLLREMPRSTLGSFAVAMDALVDLARPFRCFAIVNDVTEATHRPKGAYHDAIVKAATTVGVHWSIVISGNLLVRTISRFIMGRVMRDGAKAGITWSVHDSVDGAIVAARAAVRRAGGP